MTQAPGDSGPNILEPSDLEPSDLESSVLARSLAEFKGFGPVTCGRLAERGIDTAGDLLAHRPFRYEDRRTLATVAAICEPGTYTTVATLSSVASGWAGRRNSPSSAVIDDATGTIPALWFNRPYLKKQIRAEQTYVVHGVVREHGGRLQFYNASLEPIAEGEDPRQVVPVYGALGELGPSRVRSLVRKLIEQVELSAIEEPLPKTLLERYGLVPIGVALEHLHRPGIQSDLSILSAAESPYRRRLAFGELLRLQLSLQGKRETRRAVRKPRVYEGLHRGERLLRQALPFEPTGAQRRVLEEIRQDLAASEPMARLVQGDVGCGKTAIALGAILGVVASGYQAALMVPTELLAEQHFSSLSAWLPGEVKIGLLKGDQESASVRQEIARGEIDITVGTHALFQDATEFARLGLVIVDEQHRFGVRQRRRLLAKGDDADLLVMTATPIPRSLTLAVYGDLELSVVDELPPGRSPVVTEISAASDVERVVEAVHQEIASGGRVFFVFPAIQADENRQAPSLEDEALNWLERLQPLRCAFLSGRTPTEEREELVRRFVDGEVQVLFSTTVIEVGVDVPQAGLLVIDGAEWFGLAQLHQLRGRVGRSDRPARCLALVHTPTSEAEERLEVFASTNDGFAIADADLRLRGPGELLGLKQAGIPNLQAASLVSDLDLLEAAREEASRMTGVRSVN